MFPNVPQRQSVLLVCKVFGDKTITAFKIVRHKLNYQPGTVKLITLVTNWFKMMNVKDRCNDFRMISVFWASYINISNVLAAAKVQRFHQLLKLDILPKDDAQRKYIYCARNLDDE